jgi:hypothetical protein
MARALLRAEPSHPPEEEKIMTRGASATAALALLGAFVVIPACGSSAMPAQQAPCTARDGLICPPTGVPFVTSVFAESDFCDPDGDGVGCPPTTVPPAGASIAGLSSPADGTFCLAGSVAPNGFVAIVFRFDTFDSAGMPLTTFDAAARGITQWAFTVDTPPAGGVIPGSFGFHAGTPPLFITQPGPQVVRFADFAPNTGSSGTFDTHALPPIGLAINAALTGATDYDFCIRDFKLLDDAGNQVTQ